MGHMEAAGIKAGFRDYLNLPGRARVIMEESAEGPAVRVAGRGLVPVIGSSEEWEEYWSRCARTDPCPFSLMAVHLDEAVASLEFGGYRHPGIAVAQGGFRPTHRRTPSQRAAKIKREFCAYVNQSWFLRELGMAEQAVNHSSLIEPPARIWVAGAPRIPLVGSVAGWVECARRYSGTEYSEYLLMLMALDELLDAVAGNGETPRSIRVSGAGFSLPANCTRG